MAFICILLITKDTEYLIVSFLAIGLICFSFLLSSFPIFNELFLVFYFILYYRLLAIPHCFIFRWLLKRLQFSTFTFLQSTIKYYSNIWDNVIKNTIFVSLRLLFVVLFSYILTYNTVLLFFMHQSILF